MTIGPPPKPQKLCPSHKNTTRTLALPHLYIYHAIPSLNSRTYRRLSLKTQPCGLPSSSCSCAKPPPSLPPSRARPAAPPATTARPSSPPCDALPFNPRPATFSPSSSRNSSPDLDLYPYRSATQAPLICRKTEFAVPATPAEPADGNPHPLRLLFYPCTPPRVFPHAQPSSAATASLLACNALAHDSLASPAT